MANETFQTRRRRVRWTWIGATLVAAALIAWGLMPRPVDADFVTIDRATIRLELVDEGRTRMHDVYTVSAPLAGRLLRVAVEPGDLVTAHDVIAQLTQAPAGFLDTRSDLSARAAVDAAEAALRAADTELRLARTEHERIRRLAEDRLVAQASADTSQARLDAAAAARDASAAELTRARSTLLPADRTAGGSTVIRAPASGRVLRVLQKSESVVAAGTPLIDIGDPSHVEVVAEFLSQDAVRIRPGAAALIENWGGEQLPATVDRIEPVARMKISALGVEEQRTNVILQFDDRDAASALGHDFRVDARVTIEEAPDALRVPLGALFRHADGWAVYKVSDEQAVLTPVDTGIADTNYRVVTGGLAEGDQVVLFPGSSIRDGLRVKSRGP